MPKYLVFKQVQSVSKTKVVTVYNTSNELLGQIRFFPRWRKFIFIPEEECGFDEGCLNEIADKLKELTKEWKESLS